MTCCLPAGMAGLSAGGAAANSGSELARNGLCRWARPMVCHDKSINTTTCRCIEHQNAYLGTLPWGKGTSSCTVNLASAELWSLRCLKLNLSC